LRPTLLDPLFAPVTALPGIGPRFAKLVEKAAGPLVLDLLWHLPTGIVDRRFQPKVAEAPAGRIATMRVRVEAHLRGHGRAPYRVRCADETGTLTLVYFHVKNAEWIEKLLPLGAVRIVSGRVEHFNGQVQMTHPDHVFDPAEATEMTLVEPVYALTTGLPLRSLQKAIAAALQRAPALPEWQDAALLKREKWPPWREALEAAHAPQAEADLAPQAEADLAPETPFRRRLAYDELLASQLAVALVRAHTRRLPGRSLRGDGKLVEKAVARLPFRLTPSQLTALAEIGGDMAAPRRMLRLLQGDVGSGKTVIALLAMLTAVEAGAQAALMAPTELLARQHYATIEKYAGVETLLLTGREKGKARDVALAAIASGRAKIVVGTHALFSEDVAFEDLALAVIDEQHRFGVEQRMALSGKGRGIDILAMTATPIPRTLQLTAYGDLDVSRLTEKPAGRRPIATRAVPQGRLAEVVDAVGRAVKSGAKVYWVCPLVEESESADLAAATERHQALANHFGVLQVGLVHGRMKAAEKDATMEGFARGGIQILVATTVIEVGVDVPEATVIVIEHAERFGLAQLHQLRGRVGRSDRPSSCLLLYAEPLTETAKARLKILRETDDGFRIAEEDLRLRGAGEVLGTRQSGLPETRVADLAAHADLLPVAQDDARLALERDPELASPRGQALRALLYLFQRDAAVRFLRSG
jgi:ATP-dependent DNA helicase RecG